MDGTNTIKISKNDRVALVISALIGLIGIATAALGIGVAIWAGLIAYWGYRFIKNDISFIRMTDTETGQNTSLIRDAAAYVTPVLRSTVYTFKGLVSLICTWVRYALSILVYLGVFLLGIWCVAIALQYIQLGASYSIPGIDSEYAVNLGITTAYLWVSRGILSYAHKAFFGVALQDPPVIKKIVYWIIGIFIIGTIGSVIYIFTR